MSDTYNETQDGIEGTGRPDSSAGPSENSASPRPGLIFEPGDENSADTPGPAFFSLSMASEAFTAGFLDEGACRAWVLSVLHPEGAHCPWCGLRLEGATEVSFWSGRRCSCPRCGRGFTARAGTFLHGAGLDDRQVVLIAMLLNEGLSPARVAALSGVHPDTVRLWALKFKVLNV